MPKPKDKPRMPDPAPAQLIQLPATLDSDFDRFSSGGMRLTFETTRVDFTSGPPGKEVEGCVVGSLGGGLVVQVGERSWFLDVKDVIHAVLQADAAYLAAQETEEVEP